MAAQPARWIGGVDRVNGRIEVRNVRSSTDRTPEGAPYWIQVNDLSNAETFKVAAALGLNPKSYPTLADRLSVIESRIRTGTVWNPTNASFSAKAEEPKAEETTDRATFRSEPKAEEATTEEAEEPKAEEPKAEPKAENGDKGAADIAKAIAETIARMMPNTQAVDAEAVRKIVREETENLRPTVIQVTVNGQVEYESARTEHEMFPDVLMALGVRDNLWLKGPAGTGKTTMAQHAANALGLAFYSQSCHAQMTASQVFGFMNAQGDYVRSLFREAYECTCETDECTGDKSCGGVFLWDEIDAGSSNVLASVNAALSVNAGELCSFPDRMVRKSRNFCCIGAANTYGKGADAEYSGRAKIDEATIDRFSVMEIDYDRAIEGALVRAYLEEPQAKAWIEQYERFRSNAQSHNLKVILGTRGLVGAAKLMSAGFDKGKALNMRVFKGMSADVRRKVESA